MQGFYLPIYRIMKLLSSAGQGRGALKVEARGDECSGVGGDKGDESLCMAYFTVLLNMESGSNISHQLGAL
jgi:hypothetical protein